MDSRRFARSGSVGVFAGLKMRGRSHIVSLHNWSPGGVCVDLPGAAKLGERVHIVSGSLRGSGRIVWMAAGRAGIEFDL
ncbi:hypothetical protein ACFSCW_10035 [Sphingomonas tabacisoli]|uniref:PilZ domain-containing protein n=1 Tax=Sphingomonas tabacisoli TaxID=2249466 RepID=A0ABW4I5K1_9SPHN